MSTLKRHGRDLFVRLAIVSLCFPSVARTQSASDIAARRGLLLQAQAMADRGDHAQAAELLDRAGRISMTPSVQMALAREQFAVGRFADSFGNAELCTHAADRDLQLRDREAILSECRTLRASASSHIGQVRVVLPQPPPNGVHVSVNGNVLSDAFWGVPYTVNPGALHVTATADGMQNFVRDATVPAGQTVDVTIAFAAVAHSEAPPAQPHAAQRPERSSTDGHSHAGALIPPAIVAVLGLGGVALGAVFGLMRNGAVSQLQSACPSMQQCDPSNASLYSNAQTDALVANVGFIAGGVLAAVGVAWLMFDVLRAPKPESPRAALWVSPTPGGASIGIGGTL